MTQEEDPSGGDKVAQMSQGSFAHLQTTLESELSV